MTGWLLLWRLPGWSISTREDRTPASVTVVVPARNEERDLPGLLRSLEGQVLQPDEVVVVDDQSTDGTARVASGSRMAVLLPSAPLPEGWTGKSWACWQGAQAADGEVLVFLDADVTLGPEALDRGVAHQRALGGLFSVQPQHDAGSAIEALSLPFNVVALMGLGIGSVVPPRRQRAATGPFLVCARTDYERLGGHQSVRDEVAEDLALGRRFADAGLPVTCTAGTPDVRFRMYAGGWRELVTGWSKNFATGARTTPVGRGLGVALWTTASLLAVSSIASSVAAGWGALVVAALVYVAFAVQYVALGQKVGRFGAAGLVWPVLVLVFVAVFLWSLIATFILGRVRWGDRTIEIGRSRTRPAPPA